MSGVSDPPFRKAVADLGAGLVVSEMVASAEFVRARPDMVRRAEAAGSGPFVLQLVGCEAHWMAEGARLAEAAGADVIDINMGCPAREVTGKLSGSALMRDLDGALALIEAVIGAVRVPVTLKMRLGWDTSSQNAPALARRAEAAGVQLITVHGRTRNQFFKGRADWLAVAATVTAVDVPVLVNGDIVDLASARAALAQSKAAGVMIGRGAYGAPWHPARIGRALSTGRDEGLPDVCVRRVIALRHIEEMLAHYGTALGLRNARKHLGWYVAAAMRDPVRARAWRQKLCTDDNAVRVLASFAGFWDEVAAEPGTIEDVAA
jgi:nifR3 family TIM-barrel protein